MGVTAIELVVFRSVTVQIRIAAALAALLLATDALARQTFIVCKITQTVDDKGVASATTRTDVFVIEPQSDGSTTYTLPPGCRENTIIAKVSDIELTFECEHAVAEGFEYLITLNRISGEYIKIFSKKTASGSSGVVHYGRCATDNPQF